MEKTKKYVIRVELETLRRFRSIGRKNENDEDIIKNLLALYEEKYGNPQKELDEFHKFNSKKEKK